MRHGILILITLIAVWPACAQDSPPAVPSGTIVRLAAFPSRLVDPRNIDVWLPDGYSQARRYRVLYMHDGQALFDAQRSVSHRSWRVADTLAALLRQGKLDDMIVVGVWNNGEYRHSEYFPQKALPYLPAAVRAAFVDKLLAGTPRADRYLRFIVEELKPAIDSRFATLPDRDNTLVMGSSMGALIALYAISEYPQVFGAAGCLSTHWLGGFDNNASIPLALFDYLRDRAPDPATHRIYMDRGTLGLDANYAVPQQFFDLMMHDRGYTASNYQSRVFPGADHGEGAWADRLEIPLTFLAARLPAGGPPDKSN